MNQNNNLWIVKDIIQDIENHTRILFNLIMINF